MLGVTGLAPSATDEVGPSKEPHDGRREDPSPNEGPREDPSPNVGPRKGPSPNEGPREGPSGALPARSPRETSREPGTECAQPSRAAPPPSEPSEPRGASGDVSAHPLQSPQPPQPLLPAPACVGSAEEPLPRPGELAGRAGSARRDGPAAAPPGASGMVLDAELVTLGIRGDPLLEA